MTKLDVDNDGDNDDYDDYDDDNYQVSCGFQDAGQPAGPSGVCLVQGISSIIITTIIIIHTTTKTLRKPNKKLSLSFSSPTSNKLLSAFPIQKNYPQFLFSPVMVRKKILSACHGYGW